MGPSTTTLVAVSVAAALTTSGAVARAGSGALSGIIDLRYQRAVSGDELEVTNALTFGLRSRVLAGRRMAACFGLDLRGGVGGGGGVYGADLYAVGAGFRYGSTSAVAVCAGLGVGGVSGGALPLAWTVPIEVNWETTGQYAVVRPLVFARLARVVAGERETGSRRLGFGDELHAGAGLRVLIPDEPVPGLAVGDGLFLGVTYDEVVGDRIFGLAIGYGFATSH